MCMRARLYFRKTIDAAVYTAAFSVLLRNSFPVLIKTPRADFFLLLEKYTDNANIVVENKETKAHF